MAEIHIDCTPNWHTEGLWVIGGPSCQRCVAVDLFSTDDGATLQGTNTYNGEEPTAFRCTRLISNELSEMGVNSSTEDAWVVPSGNLTADVGQLNEDDPSLAPHIYTIWNQWPSWEDPWHNCGQWRMGYRKDKVLVSV